MKILVLLLALPLAALGWVDDNGMDSSIPSGPAPSGADAIGLSVANTFTVPSAQQMLGLDCQTTLLGLVDNLSQELMGVNWETGIQSWNLDYSAEVSNCFGTAHTYPIPYDWFVNSFTDTNLHLYDPGSATWSTPFVNAASDDGRGMAYDDTAGYLWETYTSTGVYRIDGSTGTGSFYATPEVPSQMSGLAIFEHGGSLWVVVTVYAAPDFYFYEFNGSGLTFMGIGTISLSSFTNSFGLAYSPERDTFFWSYVVYGSNRWIMEIDYSITALEQDTWGSIKSQF